jgi:hypothetical protein
MEIGLDSFVATSADPALGPEKHLSNLLGEIALADEAGLDVFGITGRSSWIPRRP